MNKLDFHIGKKDGVWLVIDFIRQLKTEDGFHEWYKDTLGESDMLCRVLDKLEERIKETFLEELNKRTSEDALGGSQE